MTRKRSALDHLKSGREPHIVTMIPPGAPGFKEAQGGAMVISSPAEVDRMLKDIRRGEVITLTDLRAAIAKKHNVAVACPVSTAIFANMVARAAEEMRAVGTAGAKLTPWWRLLRPGGFLNPKLPGGVERQAALLGRDGVDVIRVRKQLAVMDYQARVPKALRHT
jgi:alkylated DNA nucleotide flippase Atl1